MISYVNRCILKIIQSLANDKKLQNVNKSKMLIQEVVYVCASFGGVDGSNLLDLCFDNRTEYYPDVVNYHFCLEKIGLVPQS